LNSGTTVDLKNFDIDCGKDNVLTSLGLVRGVGSIHQYNYNCATNKQSQQLKCREVSTPMNDNGGGNNWFLDRHNIACDKNEALSQLKLVENDQKNKYQYKYTCCS
jgi:hypothetical protein